MMNDETYLGDGVYVSFDGYQIWLAVNHHENKVIALEPDVFARLCEYVVFLEEKT
jgi:sulfur transfer complex TusBCD TusB component (DsrH family)